MQEQNLKKLKELLSSQTLGEKAKNVILDSFLFLFPSVNEDNNQEFQSKKNELLKHFNYH